MGCEKIINLQQEGGENILNLEREMNVGGAVKSVNGMTGDVVLTTSDLENTSDYQTGSEVESAISTAVGAEATLRENADTALGGRIDNLVTGLGNEITARQTADNSLQGQIDALAASSDVTDIVGTKAQLNNYDTSKLNDNDIIKVLQDESQNDETTYYRWSTATQSFSLIGEEGPYYTKAESNVLLQAKQDVLTAGTNININNNVISATDTTYSAGNAITIDANNEISADIYPADYFTANATITAIGSDVSLDNTIPAKFDSVKLDGDTFQQTYSGANLYNYTDTSATPGSGITTDSDGWITCTIDNSAGTSTRYINYFTNPLALSPSTQYALVLEIRSVSGTGSIEGGGSNATTQVATYRVDFENMTAGSTIVIPITSKSDVSGSNGLRTYFRFNAGQSGSVTVRISVLADTSVTPETFVYQPYTGNMPSPNPDYPQDIQVVTGEQTVTVTGKNLIDPTNLSFVYSNSPSQIELSSISNGIRVVNNGGASQGRFAVFRSIDLTPYIGKVVRMKATFGASGGIRLYRIASDGSNRSQMATTTVSNTEISFTVPADLGASPYLGYVLDVTVGGGTTVDFTSLIATVDSSIDPYQSYQSQSYTISLGSIELCKIGNYQDYIYKSGDDWYVHKAVGKTVLDGSDDETWNTSSLCYYVTLADKTKSPYGVCDHFIYSPDGFSTSNTAYRGCCTGNKNDTGLYFMPLDASQSSVALFKTWLSTNQTTAYYPLATVTDTKITDATLVAQLEALGNAESYYNNTNVDILATGTNLPAIAEIAMYNNSAKGIATRPSESVTYSDFSGTDGVNPGESGLVPAPATSDAGKFLKADGTWDTVSGGGPNVVQTPGSSTTDVMSQNATTSLLFVEPNSNYRQYKIRIGSTSYNGSDSVSIGGNASATGTGGAAYGVSAIAQGSGAVAIGKGAVVGPSHYNSVALGINATTSRSGEVNIGAGTSGQGYSGTNYRVLGGVYDGQLAQDAATVNQVNATIDAINTALGTSIPHIGA